MRNALRFSPKGADSRAFRPYLRDRLMVELEFSFAPPQPLRWHDGVYLQEVGGLVVKEAMIQRRWAEPKAGHRACEMTLVSPTQLRVRVGSVEVEDRPDIGMARAQVLALLGEFYLRGDIPVFYDWHRGAWFSSGLGALLLDRAQKKGVAAHA